MNRKYWLLLGILFLACEPKPKVIDIEYDKMTQILADFHIAEEMVSKFREKDKDSVRSLFLQEISQIYGVDTSRIIKNIKIVQSEPEYAFTIYTDVYKKIDSLSMKNKSDKSDKSTNK